MALFSAVSLLYSTTLVVNAAQISPVPEPAEYILSFPTGPNPLNITIDPSPENNYFILLGDWGCAGQDTVGLKMQIGVANKMKSFVQSQKSAGKNLLFIGTMGDNFYPAGQSCGYWSYAWDNKTKYDWLATDYMWLAAWGNHDWANQDPHAMCAWSQPKYIDPITKIPYAANQINADKGGCNPPTYYLPDFGYYYSIPQLNFEYIVLEETVIDCGPGDKGFYTFDGNDGNGTIGCGYLGKMRDASENMMKERAQKSNNTNFLIVDHYEAQTQTMILNEFNNAAAAVNRNNDEYIAWSAAGHAHIQQCIHYNNKNECDTILTGGGGTGSTNDLHGFFVIGFDENKNMIQPYKIDDPTISCNFAIGECGQTFTKQEIIDNNRYQCQNDPDGQQFCNV